jgi:anti-sigma factor RsiW
MACEEIGHTLMAYIDGELDGEEKTRMENHLAECAECAEEVRAYEEVRDLAKQLRLREPPPEFWDEYPKGVFDRIGRGIGWILIIASGAVFALFGLYCLWTSGEPLVEKACITGLLLGFGILLWTVARRRVREAKTDPYKEIIR